MIKENLYSIKALLKKDTKICAVVKADAYGHGAVMVANALYKHCDYFAVALLEEAKALRYGGINKPILLLINSFEDIKEAVYYNLTMTVTSVEDLKNIISECKKQKKQAKAHIKFNSGMNRLGCDLKDLQPIIQILQDSNYVILEGIYSHLYLPEDEKRLNLQYDMFVKASEIVCKFCPNVIKHLSSSGGILKGQKYNFDMVRPGILLYGYKPFEDNSISLNRPLKVEIKIVCDRKVDIGENLLYGNYRLSESKDIAIARLGYADGFFRKFRIGNLNNLCMDLSAFEAPKGIEKIVFDDFSVIAKKYNTIPYEVLTSVTKRLEMIYI